MSYKIAALYKFVTINNIPALRREIQDFGAHCEGMCGTLLLAPEGVNGTIGATPEALDRMIDFLDSKLGIRAGELKYSESADVPFNRFKVRPKKEIITMRAPEANPNNLVGQYVEPEEWNDLIADPDVLVLDTRNDYETKVGIFEGALDPNIKIFTEFKDYVEREMDPAKQKKVAMYCTGGIRCEKASAYMLAHGFEEVYHLKGGILKYLETIPADQNKWEGDCFVFDHRVAVGHALEESKEWSVCHGCREPLSSADREKPGYEAGVSCHHCAHTLTPERLKSLRARQAHYAEKQG